MPEMALLEKTESMLKALVASGISLGQVARDSAGKVDYAWLIKFSAGKIDDPSVNRIQALHDVLRKIKPSTSA